MLLWSVLALFALGAVSKDTVTTEITTESQPPASPDAVIDPEPIPYSKGSGQVFETTDDLIQSYRRQRPVSPLLPAVIPSGQQLPTRIPSQLLEAPLETINTPGSTISNPESTPGQSPPRPTFSRSLHLRDDLTVPSSDYTEVYDIAWHAESNTARTVIENTTTIYRTPHGHDQVQFLKIKEDGTTGIAQRVCTKSPLIPASPKDKGFPGVPDMEDFQFVGYMTEEDRQVEQWQYVVVGKPGEEGAVQGESLNFTHNFFVYRDGGDAVPLRYTVVTDSSFLGPASDSYTHRYRLLPAPAGPILPDTVKECDISIDFNPERQRRENAPQKMLDPKALEDILTPTLL